MDRIPDGEPLPAWAEKMLDEAYSGGPAGVADQEVVNGIVSDLTATLGWTSEAAEAVARRVAKFHYADGNPAFAAAEDVQQWLQDTFLDTTWPACPEHQRHPLQLTDDDPPRWICPATNREVCALGHLGGVISVDEATALVNRARLEADEASTAEALARFRGWWQRRRGQ
jgi:hypothetical protein